MFNYYIYIGSSWVQVYPDAGNASAVFGREVDTIRYRKNIEGELVFIGADYDILKAQLDADVFHLSFKVTKGLTILVSGDLELVGEWDTAASVCQLNFVQNDKYTKLLNNLDFEKTIASFSTLIDIQFDSNVRERWQGTIVEPPAWVDFDHYTICGLASPDAWALDTAYTPAFKDGDTYYTAPDLYAGKFVIHSGRYYVCILGHTSASATEPGVGLDYLTVWHEIDQPWYFRQEYADFEFPGSEWVEDFYEWRDGNCTTDTYEKRIAGVKLYTLLQSILAEIDSTILISETTSGVDTGFMPYIEVSHPDWLPLYLYSFEDDPTVILSDLLNFYRVAYNLDWRLEGQRFVFRHASERPTAAGYDLTEWTINKFSFEPLHKVNKETFELGKSTKVDWTKAFIDYENGYPDKRELKSEFHVNLKRFFVDMKEAAIFCVDVSGMTVQINTGLLSGVTEVNGVLAPSHLVYRFHQAGRAFASYEDWTGESVETLTLTEIRQRKVNVNAPFRDFEDFDPETELIETDLANLEAVKIIIPLSGAMAQIEAVW